VESKDSGQASEFYKPCPADGKEEKNYLEDLQTDRIKEKMGG